MCKRLICDLTFCGSSVSGTIWSKCLEAKAWEAVFHFSRTLQYLMLVVINKCFSIRFLAKTQSTSSRRNIAYFSSPPPFQQPTRHTTADSAHAQQQYCPFPVLHPSGTTPPPGAPVCCFPVFPLLGLLAQPVPTLRGHAVQTARNAKPDAWRSHLTQVGGNEEEEGRKRGGGDGT